MSPRIIGPALSCLLALACTIGEELPLTAHGTVEVRSVDVAPLVSGRVVAIRAEEGATVRAGDTLAVLTAPAIATDLEAAEAWVRVAEANLRDLASGARPQEIQQREAELATARIEAARLAADRDRYHAMLEAGAISPREAEQVTSAARVAAERVAAAAEAVSLLREGSRPEQIEAARAEVDRARAALAGREATNREYVLVAPIDGVILSRLVEPGDLLAIGRPVLVLGELREPWVRVFVPARVLASLRVGDSASIAPPGVANPAPTGDGDRSLGPWPGRIIAINPQAEYVTRVALTEEERADLLFGIKVAIDDPSGGPKPGLPVVVTLPTARVPR